MHRFSPRKEAEGCFQGGTGLFQGRLELLLGDTFRRMPPFRLLLLPSSFMHAHFQGDSVSLTGLVLFPRASRTSRSAWSSWKRRSLREAGEHRTCRCTRPQRRDWTQW